jgi:hypothetical protein
MMLHTGYIQSRSFDIITESGDVSKRQLKGAPFGLGGALRVHFGEHLRVGAEGYVSTFSYGENDSYASVGWGGLLVDGAWVIDRWTVFAGGTVGGGSMKHIAMSDNDHDDYVVEGENAMFREYSFVVVVPFVGAEYALTRKVHLTIKMDYMCNVSNWQDDFIAGPRLYFGFMFCH